MGRYWIFEFDERPFRENPGRMIFAGSPNGTTFVNSPLWFTRKTNKWVCWTNSNTDESARFIESMDGVVSVTPTDITTEVEWPGNGEEFDKKCHQIFDKYLK